MKRPRGRGRTVPGGARIFQRVYTRLGCDGRPPNFVVEFHPYVDLTHTIRLRADTAYVRISDALHGAPRAILEAAAAILLSRLYRRQPPAALVDAYRRFSHARDTRARLLRFRRERARYSEHRPGGEHHDLEPLFTELNARYFHGALATPRLAWSARPWRTQLGCFDPALGQIFINRRLDHPAVPQCVVAYVLYHEMLHVKHPMRFVRCRRESHSSEFRKAEKRFADYARAMQFLKSLPAEN